ncbi:MAG: sugar ABC transporter substrate-binding protein [Planctomycetota bacterium]|nr:sugar ABC transporter substrate-binding protein [Planctomycetota bacterium]
MKKYFACLGWLLIVVPLETIYSGDALRVVASNTTWGVTLKDFVPDFEKDSGIRVNLEVFGEEQLQQRLMVEFSSGTSDIDVFMTRPPQEGRMMQKNGWYEDLMSFIRDDPEYDMDDYTPGSIQSTRINGVQTSIPVINECEVLFYRKDLFEEAGLEPPETFAEVEKIAAKFTDRDKEIYGFMARGQRSPLVTQFSSFFYSFGADWFNQDTKTATLNTPEALAAYEFYGRMLRLYGPEGILNMSWPQCVAIFQQGKCAMYFDSNTLYRMLMDPKNSQVGDRTGVALFPSSPNGRRIYDSTGWAIAMYSGSRNKEVAWKFIRYMTDKARTLISQGTHANPGARKSAYANPEGSRNFPPDWVKAVRDTAPYGVGYDRPLVTAVSEARDFIGTVVMAAIEGRDFKFEAEKANKAFQEILDRENN